MVNQCICVNFNTNCLELIDTTADALDAGSNIITQLRILGALADNSQRPSEILESCLLIENVMLK